MATETKTFYPGAYDSSISTAGTVTDANNPVGKGSSNTTYATINITASTGNRSVYWPFDVSAIPLNATIDSVVCKAKGIGNNVRNPTFQLYTGTTAKGSSKSVSSSSVTTATMSDATWTRAELSKIYLCTYAARATGTGYFRFYGADLTVTYTYQNEKFMLKLDGSYRNITRTFKKVKGIYIEQTDLKNVIEDGVRYKNGGEYVAPVQKITFTIAGTSYQAEAGMTWAQWCDSGYNTAGFKYGINSFYGTEVVQASNNAFVVDASGSRVEYSAVIMSGYAYSLF